jgi:hypothetical protein
LNPRPPGPQPDALPTELHSPPSMSYAPARRPVVTKFKARMARQKGFEPLTHGLEGRCSFHLSYWRESGRADLNGRPPAPKAGALPGCATPRSISINTRHSPPQPRVCCGAAAPRARKGNPRVSPQRRAIKLEQPHTSASRSRPCAMAQESK